MKTISELIERNILEDEFVEKRKRLPLHLKFPVITISREKGSGGRPIALLVAKKLGKPWKVYHKEIIDEIAKKIHLENELVNEIDERNIPFIEEIIADFFGKRYLNLNSYYRQLVKIISVIGQRGYAVIIGRGANFLLPNSLKVRIICEMPQRIAWLMEHENFTKREAMAQIEKSDAERGDFVDAVFRHDPKKAHHYDLVIRTGPNLSIENAADLIVFEAKRRFKL